MVISKVANKGCIDEIKMGKVKKFVIKAYKDILLRDPDSSGLDTYSTSIYFGKITKDAFLECLFASMEYDVLKSNLKSSEDMISLESIKEIYEIEEQEELKEERLKKRILEEERLKKESKITFISTFGIKCGIATYTMHLMNELNKMFPDSFRVDPTNEGSLNRHINGKLIHVQHEFGMMPTFPNTKSKVIITWHTVPSSINDIIKLIESELNVMAYIVHCQSAAGYINTKKGVYVISHGSTLVKEIKKEDARRVLGIDKNGINDMPIGFVFGFQNPNKLYGELINTAKNANIHLIISGSPHEFGRKVNLLNTENLTFLGRHLTEEEVDLYASASDLLLFDYVGQDHYSVSGAMHRIIGVGRPVICSNTKHFTDVVDGENVLKFDNQKELVECIKIALLDPEKERSERLGEAAREYAERTSWENAAKRHVEIYRRYVSL